MKKILLVLRYELFSAVFRRSFLAVLILIPLGAFLVVGVIIPALQEHGGASTVGDLFSPSSAPALEGYADPANILQELPEGIEERLKAYPGEEQARQALDSGEISAYYVLPPDYVQTGQIIYVRPDYNPLGGIEQSDALRTAILFNLLEQDTVLLERYQNPLVLQIETISEQPQRDPGHAMTFFLPYGVTFLFYIVILGSSGLMLNSVANEKQNRVIEILMTSITPTQMLTGKIIALGLVGLLQTLVWSGSGFLLLRLSGQTFDLSEAFQLPPQILLWGIIFFVLGYAVYSSLMAGVGALITNLREASQITFIIMIPMLLPLMFIGLLIQRPDGPFAVALSLFPLTAPVAMMTRLAATQVPFWQPALAALLLLFTAWLVVRSVSGFFRAQNLLSGQPFHARVFFQALLGRL